MCEAQLRAKSGLDIDQYWRADLERMWVVRCSEWDEKQREEKRKEGQHLMCLLTGARS